jgi:hypothetical protein
VLLEGEPRELRETVPGQLASATLDDQAFPLVGRLARLSCTRIGSPDTFGVQNTKALFMVVNRRSRASVWR